MTTSKTSSTPPGNDRRKSPPWGRWLAVIFIAGSMFVLGVLVGRGTAPVEFDIDALQKELNALKAEQIRQDIQRYKIEPGTDTHKVDLNFYEALKATDEPEAETAPPAKGTGPSVPAPPVAPASDAAQAPEAVSRPPSREPAGEKSAGEEIDGSSLTLQVASMKDAAAAANMVAELSRDGFAAYRTEAAIPDKGTWYRVRVGRFGSREEAATVMNRLEARDFQPILIQQ